MIEVLPACEEPLSTIQYTGPGGRVRLAGHDLLRQAAERLDPGLRLDPVEQVRVMNVPRGGTRAFRRARTRTHSGSGGQALARWFPELVGTTIDQELHRAVREQETVVYEIDSTVTASWVQVHAYPTTDGGLSVYGRDITERKEVEQLVGEAREAERGRIARALHDDALRGLSDAIALVAMRTGPRRSLGWPVSCCLFCGESVSSIIKQAEAIETDRPEVKLFKQMIYPAIDSLQKAIKRKDVHEFSEKFYMLTNSCNNCHKSTHFDFNKIQTPERTPYSNQDFSTDNN